MNYSRAVGVARFVLVILIIALLMTLAVCGYSDWDLGGVFEKGTVVLGLDLQGGSVITFQAIAGEDESITGSGMDSVQAAMRTRLDNAGLTEANAYLVGSDMITIEIPGDSDPNEAVKNFGAMGKLTFRTYSSSTDEYDTIILTGDDVKKASAVVDSQTGDNVVELNFTTEGAKKFYNATLVAAAATSGSSANCIAIYMDDTMLSCPSVENAIEGGSAVISTSSGMTSEYALSLAGNINSGSLKYTLKEASIRTVGPTLGEKSLTTSLKAGALGIAFVVIFMIAVYRVPGVMASIALVAYSALFMLLLVITKSNLTLPGIAGIILSIGMAVDANVVIFERTKEELRAGKSAKAAIKSGYSKAFSAIFDSNVTTLIAAGVLFFLGSGTIQGFAVTLSFGVIISFFTALVITRILLNLGCSMGLNKITLYGVSERRVDR
ncbi:MAG: protein translocase subunit SecD [Eubacteriales bacterium]|nr:protein translocase subunit SecD [Eubacteriales bacterium]